MLTRGSRVPAGIFFGRVGDAIGGGKPIFATRLRYESVDQSGLRNRQGDAVTLRTVLGYESGTIHDIAGTLTGTANFELLSADNGVGFSPPLATGHKFAGWADVFTAATPGAGLEDREAMLV
ncbi:MAG: hypothetical protein EXR08_06570 [Alphaproteobacteria bacterium]|nr:hypothetical protein [Alphaproteobacteria bacterium]